MGVNATLSVRTSPGLIVVPSGNIVVAAKAPPTGGLDFVIVTFVPPVLVIVKDFVTAAPPPGSLPYSFVSPAIFSPPEAPAVPERPIAPLPPVVSRPMLSLNVPSCVGSKETVTVSEAPAAIVAPAVGAPLALKGAAGRFTLLIVSGAPPTLRNVAVLDRWPPTVVPPKETSVGVTSSCALAAWPVPETANVAFLPVLVVAVSVAPTTPVCVGVNVTGTEIVWPADSVAGSAGTEVPSVNWLELDASVESVSASVAVSVRVFWVEWPRIVAPKASVDPVNGGVTGEPKPSTWPSRVPTYRRPAPTPGVANFGAVPTGAL